MDYQITSDSIQADGSIIVAPPVVRQPAEVLADLQKIIDDSTADKIFRLEQINNDNKAIASAEAQKATLLANPAVMKAMNVEPVTEPPVTM